MMKLKLWLLPFAFSCSLSAYAQKLDVFVQGNTYSQWVKNPERKSDGTFAYDHSTGLAAGIGRNIPLNQWASLTYRLKYVQKGYKLTQQFPDGPNSLSDVTNHYTMHYAGLDQLLKISPSAFKGIYLLAGLSNERLIADNLPQTGSNPHSFTNIEADQFHRWSFGALGAVGYRMDNWFAELAFNADLTPSYRNDDTLIRNHGWGLNIGFSL
jgi:hypothetical protein